MNLGMVGKGMIMIETCMKFSKRENKIKKSKRITNKNSKYKKN